MRVNRTYWNDLSGVWRVGVQEKEKEDGEGLRLIRLEMFPTII